MTIKTRSLSAALMSAAAVLLTGCQGMQGAREGDLYHAPTAAYSIDLSMNTFRGHVTMDERCDPYGGSTTMWDASGRMFRIDYLRAEGNPNLRIPRFAADQTLLNLVLNGYLRSVVADSPMITSAEVVYREQIQDSDPRAIMSVVSLDVDSSKVADSPEVSGLYYYGFLLFKKGELIYVVQHRQPALMPDTMKSVLLRIADAMEMPGKERDETELERTRRMLARIAPGGSKAPARLCSLPTVANQ
ncbi:MAG: hypothetical protein P1U78_03420 [Alcanivoracaceae bacterium]|nr:hypothetical protein [Alcanivoracaceae bacterium]